MCEKENGLKKKTDKRLRTNNQLPETKICTKCNLEKLCSDFAQDINKSDGLYSSCKICNQEYFKHYRELNREKVSKSKKKAVAKKPEHYTEYKNNWYLNNKEELKK